MEVNISKNYTFASYVAETHLVYIEMYDGKGNRTYLQIRENGTVNLVNYNNKLLFQQNL